MKIAVVGTGYVGLVLGACLAENGNDVMCVDKDEAKIDTLNRGGIPIYEPGLEELVKKNVAAGRLAFTHSTAEGVQKSDVIFIAVPTPLAKTRDPDMSYVLSATETVARRLLRP